jgi:hypothetical protein
MPPHERHREAACQVLDRLLQKASMRLRKAQFVSTHLSVYVGYVTQKNTPQNTLYFASSHEALDSAPMRIAFNRTPDLGTES